MYVYSIHIYIHIELLSIKNSASTIIDILIASIDCVLTYAV